MRPSLTPCLVMSTLSGLDLFSPISQQHGCRDGCLCAQAWQYTDNTVEGFTEAVTSVCLGSLDARFQTHSIRLLDTLMAAVEHDFHGELLADRSFVSRTLGRSMRNRGMHELLSVKPHMSWADPS